MQACLPFVWKGLRLHAKPQPHPPPTLIFFIWPIPIYPPRLNSVFTWYRSPLQIGLLSVPTLFSNIYTMNVLLICLPCFPGWVWGCWIGVCHLSPLVRTSSSSLQIHKFRNMSISFCASGICEIDWAYKCGTGQNRHSCEVKSKE